MKIKWEKFSLDITVKDLEWFNKLPPIDQLKILAILIGGTCALNTMAMSWYKTIKEENRKDKILNDEIKINAKKVEISKGGNHE